MLADRGRGPSTTRSALVPSSAIPVAYFAFAHVCFAAGLAALALDPGLAGASFYHPKMIALVHLLTLGWISGSILGSFYVVAPLALAIPMPAGRRDWTAFAAFATGTTGMVAHFWLGTHDGMAWSAGLVLAAIAHLGWRATRGLSASPAAWPVALHVRLAFFNILAAGVFGILIGLDRTRGFVGLAPVAATYAHAHLAALGWAVMMVMGLSYRLIPMMLPSAMPSGRSLAASAVLVETGLALLVLSVLAGWPLVPAAGVFILCGLAAFVLQIMRTAVRRLPRPPALPRRDWSIWQVHAAFLWLLIAAVLGYTVSRADAAPDLPRAWVYGTAGLIGFLAQIIIGMHGRLVPYYAWYRAMAAGGGRPRRGANALPSARFARAVFLAWLAGVPLLAWGFAAVNHRAISTAAVLLLTGVALHAAHLVYMLVHARTPLYSMKENTMTFTPATTVAELARTDPATIAIFQKHGIDFCCGGKRPLQDVCAEKQISYDTLASELASASAPASPARPRWDTRPLRELTAHIVESFHDPLSVELPRLLAMARRVEERHGRDSQPNAGAIADTLEAFIGEVMPHMREEEDDVFPLIERIESGAADASEARRLGAAQAKLESEHDGAGQALATLKTLSNQFQAAAGACPTTLGLYYGLGELDALMTLHVHLENNVLFPRADVLAQAVR